MPSELEKLVAELRAVAAEAEKLRPRLVRHAGLVRDFAAEIAADPEQGRSMGHTQAASLLQQASRQCDALAAELGRAKVAADHFAGRVLSGGGGPGPVDRAAPPPRPAPIPAAEAAGERGHGPLPPPAPSDAPKRGKEPPSGAQAGGELPAVAAPAPTDAGKPPLPPFVPWWIPNGAPWHGHRGHRATPRGRRQPAHRVHRRRPDQACRGRHGTAGRGRRQPRQPPTATARATTTAMAYRRPGCRSPTRPATW